MGLNPFKSKKEQLEEQIKKNDELLAKLRAKDSLYNKLEEQAKEVKELRKRAEQVQVELNAAKKPIISQQTITKAKNAFESLRDYATDVTAAQSAKDKAAKKREAYA